MKRTLAILAVPLLAGGAIAAIAYGSMLAGGAFGPLLGWPATTGFVLCAAVLAAAFAAEGAHRLMDYISTAEPAPNRRRFTSGLLSLWYRRRFAAALATLRDLQRRR